MKNLIINWKAFSYDMSCKCITNKLHINDIAANKSESYSSFIHIQGTSAKSFGRRGRSAALVGSGWGVRSGTEDEQKDDLKKIITAELIKPENHGDNSYSYYNFKQFQ